MRSPLLALLGALVAVALAGCGGSSAQDDPAAERAGAQEPLTMWISENQPDRMRTVRRTLDAFTRRTGLRVELVGIGDGELDARLRQVTRSGRGPDVVQLPMAEAHAYARAGLLSPEAAQEVVDRLGEETFSARALSLLTSEGRLVAVPSDGWGQLLVYRRDLFAAAGIAAPRTLDDVRRAARRLHRPGRAGITLGTTTSSFTEETFEHVALAAGCQLVDDRGQVTLTSAACRRAFAAYADLAAHSPGGRQDVERTRDAYFAGRAAMVLWSPFLLDAMAGLRDDALPTCPECRDDPAFLARRSGLVGPLTTPRGEQAQFGTISTWGILADGDVTGAERLVDYLMSDGYEDWLSTSPQGKYPVRLGDRAEPERFVEAWGGLESGVDRKAPLGRYYSARSLASVGEGARSFRRWGFEQGEAALIGALAAPLPVTKAVVASVEGLATPEQAAQQAQTAVELIQDRQR